MSFKCIIYGVSLTTNLILLIAYVSYLPYLPMKHIITPNFNELDRNLPIEVLNKHTGIPQIEGWSRYPNKILYNFDMNNHGIFSSFKRLSLWNYFYFIADDYLVTMAHSDSGYVQAAYFNVRNIKDYSQEIIESTAEVFWPKAIHIDFNKNGEGMYSTIVHKNLNFTIFYRPGTKHGSISVHANTRKGILSGDLNIDFSNAEGITGIKMIHDCDPTHSKVGSKISSLVTDQSLDTSNHISNSNYFYGTKTPLLKFTGELTLNGKSLLKCSEKSPCLGLNDSGKSYMPYINSWIWASSCFAAKSVHSDDWFNIGFSIGYSTVDSGSQLEAFFINGKLYKIDPLVLVRSENDRFHWIKNKEMDEYPKNTIELFFVKDHFHQLAANFIVSAVDFKSYFGKFSGEIKTEDGHHIRFENVFGFVEDFHARF